MVEGWEKRAGGWGDSSRVGKNEMPRCACRAAIAEVLAGQGLGAAYADGARRELKLVVDDGSVVRHG